jgi:hypothetical protein
VLNYKFRFLIVLFGGVVIFSSCNKKPESIGLDLVDHSKLPVFDTTFSVVAYSTVEDSVVTDETSINLLGSQYTENFGLTVASIYTHLRLLGLSPDFGDDPQLDSAFLTLVYSGYYGDTLTPQTIKIYEVIEDFYKDSTYYSTDKFNVSDVELANFTFYPYPTDSVTINDSTEVSAQINIPLNELFVNKIFYPDVDSALVSNDKFLEYFKGIYITVDSMASPGEGAILYFNLMNARSKVTIYYNDSLTYNLVFNTNSARIGNFHHNYGKSLNPNFRSQILDHDTLIGTENLYLQGLAGVKTIIKMPSISAWVNLNNYAINDAKLTIPVSDYPEELTPASRLVLFKLNESSELEFTDDQLEGDNYFGGSFNDSTDFYQFRLSFYMQDLLNGTPDYGLVMLISGKTTNANEVRLSGTEPGITDPSMMNLKIVYTKLNNKN